MRIKKTLLAGTTVLLIAAPTASAAATTTGKSIPVPAPATQRAASVNVPVTMGASAWKGEALRHPRGGRFYPQVKRWANLVSAVMQELNIPDRYLPGILAQIQQESGGRPKAVNNWDSNAAAGHPSKGLLQVILPTYKTYAKKGYKASRYQTVPATNIYAALNYVLHTYGPNKFNLWNRGINPGY